MKYKHSQNRRERNNFNYISENDKEQLELLNLQIKMTLIYMISDLFFFLFTIEGINLSCNKKERHANPIELLLQGLFLALIASILDSYIVFSRYNNLSKRYKQVEKSLEPELMIRQGSILTVLLYSFNIIGVTMQYKASLFIDIFKCNKRSIDMLFLQGACFLIRFYGDYFFLRSTLKSIDLIRSKYDKNIKNIYNPDIDAVIAAGFYVIQRGLLYDINYNELVSLINNGSDLEKELLIPVNKITVIANIFGVIANITVLVAFIKIYNRNVNQPIFGR